MTEREGLTAEPRQRVPGRVKTLGDQADSARLITERLGSLTHFVHCGSVTVVHFGYPAGPQRFRCKDCGMTFMALTRTPVQRWREPEEWVACMDCMNQGLTLRASATAVGLMID